MATMVQLKETFDLILHSGPTRVMINRDMDATTSQRAREEYNIVPDIIFIRNDGWSLGAPSFLEKEAFSCWKESWIGFARRGELVAKPIEEY